MRNPSTIAITVDQIVKKKVFPRIFQKIAEVKIALKFASPTNRFSAENKFQDVMLILKLSKRGMYLKMKKMEKAGKRKSLTSKILKTAFFIPNITTASAVAILWIWIFDPDYGLAGQLFNLLGKQSPRWLLTPGYAMWIIISLSVWRSIGYVMLIYTSGLSGINDEVYESATIDGASPWQQITKITIPLLKPTTYFLLLTSFIQAMQVFDIVSVMTGGGPFNSTNVLNLYIYQTAFARSRAGYASALSVVLFFILLFFTVVQRKFSADKGEANA